MKPARYAGSCLCGAVAYEIETAAKKFYFCHCEQCRKLTGSAHASNILTQPAPIRWVRGEEKIKRYDAPAGRQFTHVFCRECGSGLPFMNVSKTSLIIPAGSLDTKAGIEVSNNIFWEEVPEWYEGGIAARPCERFPE